MPLLKFEQNNIEADLINSVFSLLATHNESKIIIVRYLFKNIYHLVKTQELIKTKTTFATNLASSVDHIPADFINLLN